MPGGHRFPAFEGEVACSAVSGLLYLVKTLFASGVRPRCQDLGAVAEARCRVPSGWLGISTTAGCKAFKAIKKMMCDHITVAAFDEAAAADGSCPLEQVADASGIAVGGSADESRQGQA